MDYCEMNAGFFLNMCAAAFVTLGEHRIVDLDGMYCMGGEL